MARFSDLDEFGPTIDAAAAAIGGSETGRHRSYVMTYPATREPTALIGTGVLLEMGAVDPIPTRRC